MPEKADSAKRPRVHLIVGPDQFLTDRAARAAIDRAVPPDAAGAAVVERIDGAAGAADEQLRLLSACRESVMTPPFFEPFKTTWWRDVSFLPQAKGPSEEVRQELERFAAYLAESPLPDNQLLVITAPALNSASAFAKRMKQVAEVVAFSAARYARERAQEAESLAESFAGELGLKFGPGAAAALVAVAGVDARKLLSEVEKLRDYLGPGGGDAITLEAVNAVAAPGAGEEPEPWDFTDAIGRRDVAGMCRVLARYEESSGNGIMLANSAERFFRQLAALRDAQDRGLGADALAPLGFRLTPFQLRKNAAFARNYSLSELRTARARALRVRAQLVSSGSDLEWRTLLEKELLRTVAPRRGGRR